jgi:hypothetical protein
MGRAEVFFMINEKINPARIFRISVEADRPE